jgi:serine/threonine-protein kinase
MAEVYLARGMGGFDKQLVIKRILPHLTGDPEFVEMFLNEARIAARLNHPNVCQVFELSADEGNLYLVMEYLEGLTWGELSPLVPRDGGFELRCAAAVIGQVCEGLRYAHELHDVHGAPTPVVHRDVSPQNLMITTAGLCKLFDFGVSKVMTEGSRTRTGMLKGKLPYMAPEQIRGEPVDPRADVFSMGVVLWEALTGERLFERDSDYLVWRAVIEGDIPSVTSRQPRLPHEIDAVVARALERDAGRRYPTIRAFASELRQVADRIGGPLDQPTLAELVRSLGAAQLARRAQLVREALRSNAEPWPTASEPVAIPELRPAVVTDPSATHSVRLRDRSVRLGLRGRRAWWWIPLGALVMTGSGIAAAVWTAEPEQPAPVAIAGTRDAAIARSGDPQGEPAPLDAGTELAGRLDDQLVEPEPPVAAEAVKRKAKHVANRRPAVDAAVVEPGQYSVDSKPYATIFIDGRSFGETPLFKISLPPGRHRVRAVRVDGQVQRHTVTIEPGKLTSSGTLAW